MSSKGFCITLVYGKAFFKKNRIQINFFLDDLYIVPREVSCQNAVQLGYLLTQHDPATQKEVGKSWIA